MEALPYAVHILEHVLTPCKIMDEGDHWLIYHYDEITNEQTGEVSRKLAKKYWISKNAWERKVDKHLWELQKIIESL